MSTVPIAFATAIYGLKYRANLQPGEVCDQHAPRLIAYLMLIYWGNSQFLFTLQLVE
jgi:hypothetical protein